MQISAVPSPSGSGTFSASSQEQHLRHREGNMQDMHFTGMHRTLPHPLHTVPAMGSRSVRNDAIHYPQCCLSLPAFCSFLCRVCEIIHYMAQCNIHRKTLEQNAKCIDLIFLSHTVIPTNSGDQENLYFKTHIREKKI